MQSKLIQIIQIRITSFKYSKDPNNFNNFLWILLKPKDNVVKDILKLDKVDNSIFLKTKVLNEVSYKPNVSSKDIELGIGRQGEEIIEKVDENKKVEEVLNSEGNNDKDHTVNIDNTDHSDNKVIGIIL